MYLAGGNYDAYTNPQSSFGRGRQPQPQKSPRILSQLKQQNQVPDSYYEGTGFQDRISRAGQLMGVGGGQFGQMQMGQASGPSLEEVLSQRGFKMPEMQTGMEPSISLMYKDPITGKMQSGGPHAASHAKAMSNFYQQNPEALDIAKQHKQDQQYNPGGGLNHFNAAPLRPPQEIMPQPFQDRRARDPQEFNRSNPYSAPPQMGGGFGGQMGGGMGGGQGMGQFMQFMQTMMQMFQQFQGGGGRGMGGGFGGPSPFMPQQQQYGQYQRQPAQSSENIYLQPQIQPRRMSNQFNPNNAFGGY